MLYWKSMRDEEIKESLEISITLLQENIDTDIAETERIFLEKAATMGDRGTLLWPLRVALTGKKSSPGPFEIMGVLGIKEALVRLKKANIKLSE